MQRANLSYRQRFSIVWQVGAPNPPIVQGSTIIAFFHSVIPDDSLSLKPDFNMWYFVLKLFASQC